MNSTIFCTQESDNYFKRNRDSVVSKYTWYLIEQYGHILSHKEVAEFGIGNGANLKELVRYCGTAHGYEYSERAIEYVNDNVSHVQLKKVDLTKPFEPMQTYGLIIWGFIAYYFDDDDMQQAMYNTMHAFKKNGLLYVYDFVSTGNRQKTDKHNTNLIVYKRSYMRWFEIMLNYDFTLLDYKLWDDHGNEDDWTFTGLWRWSG